MGQSSTAAARQGVAPARHRGSRGTRAKPGLHSQLNPIGGSPTTTQWAERSEGSMLHSWSPAAQKPSVLASDAASSSLRAVASGTGPESTGASGRSCPQASAIIATPKTRLKLAVGAARTYRSSHVSPGAATVTEDGSKAHQLEQ